MVRQEVPYYKQEFFIIMVHCTRVPACENKTNKFCVNFAHNSEQLCYNINMKVQVFCQVLLAVYPETAHNIISSWIIADSSLL